jgi:hypothetical protein
VGDLFSSLEVAEETVEVLLGLGIELLREDPVLRILS